MKLINIGFGSMVAANRLLAIVAPDSAPIKRVIQEARDEALDVLKMVTESAESSEEAKAEAQQKISKIAVDIQNEANIETLVKAKGFEDCVAIISEGAVSVIVSAESLQAAEAAQILSIVYETTGINPENISIISKS